MITLGILGSGNTGASVVTDYLREFDNVSTLSREFNFLEQADGIIDLEYYLCHQCNRNKAGVAVSRFLKNIKNYRNYIFIHKNKKEFVCLSKQYIQDLGIVSWKGYSSIDPKDLRRWPDREYTWFFARVFNKFFRMFKIKKQLPGNHKMYFGFVKEEDFIRITKEYFEKLFHLLNLNSEIIALEQLFSVTNPTDGFKYLTNPKAIIVKRDIRDVFASTNLSDPHDNRFMPCRKNVDDFKKYYRDLLNFTKKVDSNDVQEFFFEDLVLHYDENTARISDFLKLDKTHHVKKYRFFNPEISKKNIGIYKNYPEFAAVFDELKKEFPELIYE